MSARSEVFQFLSLSNLTLEGRCESGLVLFKSTCDLEASRVVFVNKHPHGPAVVDQDEQYISIGRYAQQSNAHTIYSYN